MQRLAQEVADIDLPLSGVAARDADAEVIEQRIGCGVRMLLHIVDGIETRMRIAQLRRTGLHVMQQGVEPARRDIRVVLYVPRTVEETIWITPLGGTVTDEMLIRTQVAAGDVGIARPIPVRIEKRPDQAGQRGLLQRGVGERGLHRAAPTAIGEPERPTRNANGGVSGGSIGFPNVPQP
jgi:hypothetical protein